VFSIHLDTALNLMWAAISVAALLWFARIECSRGGRVSPHGRYRRLFAVCLMTVVIFPSISDSDDLFHFSLLQIPTRQSGGFGSAPQEDREDRQEKANLQLARLLETLEHFQVSGFHLLTFGLYCVAVSLSLRLSSFTRCIGCNAGRAPPLA
jgi:hypothetical protein